MTTRTRYLLVGLISLIIVGAGTAALLWPRKASLPPAQPSLLPPIAVAEPPALTQVFARKMFWSDTSSEPVSGPELVGIAGRIGHDAVAIVRDGSGASRVLQIGESADGWTLASLAPDAAFFTRGGEQLRVPLSFDEGSAAAGGE